MSGAVEEDAAEWWWRVLDCLLNRPGDDNAPRPLKRMHNPNIYQI